MATLMISAAPSTLLGIPRRRSEILVSPPTIYLSSLSSVAIGISIFSNIHEYHITLIGGNGCSHMARNSNATNIPSP